MQPPSGGCVLKPDGFGGKEPRFTAATFGWLCVETPIGDVWTKTYGWQPPSGGCVLKL